MKGYDRSLSLAASGGGDPTSDNQLEISTPVKLPDALRGEKYAFVSLPIGEFLEGGSIGADNIGVGELCPIPNSESIASDAYVFGVVILSQRSAALASWLAGTGE